MALPPRHEGTRFPAAALPAGTPSPRRQATNARLSSSFSNCPIRTSRAICSPAMSQTIPDTRPCAAHCCSELNSFPRDVAAALLVAWLRAGLRRRADRRWLCRCARASCLSLAVLLPGMPLPSDRSSCSQDRSAVRTHRVVGRRVNSASVLGPQLTPHPPHLPPGSFRLGVQLWRSAVHDTGDGIRAVLIAGGVQDAGEFRRLSRCLAAHLRRASGRSAGQADTIRPKV